MFSNALVNTPTEISSRSRNSVEALPPSTAKVAMNREVSLPLILPVVPPKSAVLLYELPRSAPATNVVPAVS